MPLQVDLIFQGYTSGQRNHQAHHDIHQDHVHQYTQLTQHSYTGKEQNIPLQIIRATAISGLFTKLSETKKILFQKFLSVNSHVQVVSQLLLLHILYHWCCKKISTS